MPNAIGTAQWIVTGRQVQLNPSWPPATKKEPMIITRAVASGGTLPVSGSFGCALISLRQSGSAQIPIIVPIPIPTKASPEVPGPQPLYCVNTIGYATKQRYRIP